MNESVAIAKEADTKKSFSPTKSDKSIHRVRDEPHRQLGTLRGVIGNIRRDGSTPSADSIATELGSMRTGERAPVLLALQQTHGNRYVQRVVSGIQAKLKIGQPGDRYEQEADRVADAVMRMPEPGVQRQVEPEEEEEELQTKPLAEQITPLVQRQVEPGEEEEGALQAKPLAEEITPLVQRQVEPEEEEEELQAKVTSGRISEVNSNLESHILSLKGGGQPLSPSVHAFFESRFGTNFGSVRVHRDSRAAETAQAVNAKAFTVGRDVAFGDGHFAPETSEGRKLLAHELAHVVQQGNSNSFATTQHRPPALLSCKQGDRHKTTKIQDDPTVAGFEGVLNTSTNEVDPVERVSRMKDVARRISSRDAQLILKMLGDKETTVYTRFQMLDTISRNAIRNILLMRSLDDPTVVGFQGVLNTSTNEVAPVKRVVIMRDMAHRIPSEDAQLALKMIDDKETRVSARFQMLHTASRRTIRRILVSRSKVSDFKFKADFQIKENPNLPSATDRTKGRKDLAFKSPPKEWAKATIEFNKGGQTKNEGIKLKIRGANRHIDCAIPPYKIRFDRDPSLMFNTPSKKAKLVSHCLKLGLGSSKEQRDEADQQVIKEYLIYKIAEKLLGDMTFKTDIAFIDYRDLKDKSLAKGFAILIEHKKDVAKRVGGKTFSKKEVAKMIKEQILKEGHFFNSRQIRMELFHALISNPDWGMEQNTAVIEKQGSHNLIPYDFDFSAHVEPDPDNPITNFENLFEQVIKGGKVLKGAASKNKKEYRRLLTIEMEQMIGKENEVLRIIRGSLLNRIAMKKFEAGIRKGFRALRKKLKGI